MKFIPYGRQSINSDDKKLVLKSLEANLITTGSYVAQFEKKLKRYFGTKYTLACSSATAGLHLAFLSLDIKKNDNIIVPAINFIASYNMLSILGANIYLCDVNSETGQMSPELISECIKLNKLKKIKAIVTMYLGGYPSNIVNFYKIKKKYRCFLIEDACHALGAKYRASNQSFKIGSCKHSDIAVFSLHPVKPITSGEGGIVCTNNLKIHKKIELLRSHGIKRTKKHWIYDIEYSGYNYRLSDINCALAISQLSRINDLILKREKIFNYYKKKLTDFPKDVKILDFNPKITPSYHLVLAYFNFKKMRISKDFFINMLIKKKIIVQQHYIPIFKFKKIFKQKINIRNYKGTINYYNNTISLPIYYDLSKKKIDYIMNTIKKILNKYAN